MEFTGHGQSASHRSEEGKFLSFDSVPIIPSKRKSSKRTYKKLALDALVIQQGRLQQNQKSVNKEDLANMVRFGAEHIFDSTAVTDLTAEDVDAIIAKGEEATKQLNEKMSGFTDKALKFFHERGRWL